MKIPYLRWWVAALLFTWLTGHIVERFSYQAIFILMGFLHPLAYLIFVRMVLKPVVSS